MTKKNWNHPCNRCKLLSSSTGEQPVDVYVCIDSPIFERCFFIRNGNDMDDMDAVTKSQIEGMGLPDDHPLVKALRQTKD